VYVTRSDASSPRVTAALHAHHTRCDGMAATAAPPVPRTGDYLNATTESRRSKKLNRSRHHRRLGANGPVSGQPGLDGFLVLGPPPPSKPTHYHH